MTYTRFDKATGEYVPRPTGIGSVQFSGCELAQNELYFVSISLRICIRTQFISGKKLASLSALWKKKILAWHQLINQPVSRLKNTKYRRRTQRVFLPAGTQRHLLIKLTECHGASTVRSNIFQWRHFLQSCREDWFGQLSQGH